MMKDIQDAREMIKEAFYECRDENGYELLSHAFDHLKAAEINEHPHLQSRPR
jgi:hypothetical protein